MSREEARSSTGSKSNSEILPHLVIRSQQAKVETRNIADVFGRPHDKVMLTIRSLISDGTISPAEFSDSDFTTRGKKYPYIELNKAGFLKAMPFIGGRKSREGQRILVDEFMLMEKLLTKQSKERETIAFQLVRTEGKDVRKVLTDAISKFINYAIDNGSQGADRYYSIITQLTYKSFLLIEPKASQVREILTAVQLSQLQTLELMAATILTKGMDSKQTYKKIYQQLKTELNEFSSNKTQVLNG